MIKLLIKDICLSGMTKATLAYKIGVTPTALSRWATGKAVPRMKHLEKLEKVWKDVLESNIN